MARIIQSLECRASDTDKLQAIMHFHGLEEFKKLLRQAYYNAADAMEEIDLETSDLYRAEAQKMDEEEL